MKENMSFGPDPNTLKELVTTKMPFGKYKDTRICDLPESYLQWFQMQGFPKGKIGMLLETMCVIRTNGLHQILQPFKNQR
ncbi:DUF3820 family protein [Chitinophaga skermanii]|nr:DUF3820 family protein [Chitinophaga skermanii]